MKISLLVFSSLIIVSSADEKKLRGRNLGKDRKYADIFPSNVVMDSNYLQLEPYVPGTGVDNDNDNDNDRDTGKDETETGESDDHDEPPNEGKDDPMADVREIAKMSGLSMDDTMLLLQQQQDFSELAAKLQNEKSFLQTEMPSVPNGEFVIQFQNGDIPSDGQIAIREFAKKHSKTNVKISPSRLSLHDAEERAERLSNRLEEMKYGQVSYTIDGDNVDIEAKKPADDESRDIGKIPSERAAKLFGLNVDDEELEGVVLVLVDFDDDDIAQPLHTYGGRQIFGGGFQCTNAFSVITSNGETGTSTAGHCDGMTTYNAVPPEANYALTSTNEHEGSWGDLQWHRTPHIEPAYYYSWPNTRWPVRSVANSVSKGEWVCSYSRMKGDRRCDKVFRTSVSVNYNCCPKMKRLVAMERNFNIPGDSGGPWSFYDKAYGIVSGSKTICNWWIFGCRRRDLWSRVSYLGPSLGVQVRTL